MKILLTIVFLAFTCAAQTKDRWITLSASVEDDKIEALYYLDTESVERKGDEIQFWLKRKPTAPKDKIDHTLVLYVVNCATKKMRTPNAIDYTKGGSVIDDFDMSSMKATLVVPNSVGEGILRKMCARY